jgi:hypothetical protein
MAGRVGEHIGVTGIQIDPLEVAEIDGIGRGGPAPTENVGIGDLKPEARPSAAGVARYEPALRSRYGSVKFFDIPKRGSGRDVFERATITRPLNGPAKADAG